jgi:hypothetical protein
MEACDPYLTLLYFTLPYLTLPVHDIGAGPARPVSCGYASLFLSVALNRSAAMTIANIMISSSETVRYWKRFIAVSS